MLVELTTIAVKCFTMNMVKFTERYPNCDVVQMIDYMVRTITTYSLLKIVGTL